MLIPLRAQIMLIMLERQNCKNKCVFFCLPLTRRCLYAEPLMCFRVSQICAQILKPGRVLETKRAR